MTEKRHFTQIELLLTILVFATFAALLLPAVSHANNMGMKDLCAANLKRSVMAMKMYAGDFDGMIPVYHKFPQTVAGKNPAEKHNLYTWAGALYQTGYLPAADPAARCPQMGTKMVVDTKSRFYKNSSYGALTSNKQFFKSYRRNQLRVLGKRNEFRFVITGKLISPETFPLLVDTIDQSKREYWAFSTDFKDGYGMHARHDNMIQSAFADGSVQALTPENFRTHCRKSGLYENPSGKYGYFNMAGQKVAFE